MLAYKENVGFQIFSGCNVENRFFPATICAERNAVTTAIARGYNSILKVAIACKKIPGGNSCGLCRQVLTEWGLDAVVYNVVDSDLNVRRFQVKDLLPAAPGPVRNYPGLEKRRANADPQTSGPQKTLPHTLLRSSGHGCLQRLQ